MTRVGDPELGDTPSIIEPADPQGTIADTLRRAEEATVLLGVRLDDGDAGAYKHWLVEIADQVVTAAQTGGLLGLGGEEITESERVFRDDLAAVLNDYDLRPAAGGPTACPQLASAVSGKAQLSQVG